LALLPAEDEELSFDDEEEELDALSFDDDDEPLEDVLSDDEEAFRLSVR
jgi:hypothetical protein